MSKEICERRERGGAAWTAVVQAGGLWPEASDGFTPQEEFWEALGSFSLSDFEPVIADTLPHAEAARCWPWLARATYQYKWNVQIPERYVHWNDSVQELRRAIIDKADGLLRDLMALDQIAARPATRLIDPDRVLARGLIDAINAALGGAASALHPNIGMFDLQRKLHVASRSASGVPVPPTNKSRGVSNPWLRLLVWELAMFWAAATDRQPSSARPSRADGRDGPFVRLVQGCAALVADMPVSRKQVETLLKDIPKEV